MRKFYISADIEGVAGILDWGETDKIKNDDYTMFREIMTNEVLASIESINEKFDKVEIVVKDAHDSGRNMYFDRFPENVKIIRGWSGDPYSMVQGLDDTYDGLIYIGYHSESSSSGNPLSHTMTSSRLNFIKINGKIISEFELHSIIASHYNVPVLFVSGDYALTKTVKNINNNIGTVATKLGEGNSILSKTPELVNKEIKKELSKVLDDVVNDDDEKYLMKNPNEFHVEVCYKTFQLAYNAKFFPGVSLKDSQTVEFTTNDYYEVVRTLKFII